MNFDRNTLIKKYKEKDKIDEDLSAYINSEIERIMEILTTNFKETGKNHEGFYTYFVFLKAEKFISHYGFPPRYYEQDYRADFVEQIVMEMPPKEAISYLKKQLKEYEHFGPAKGLEMYEEGQSETFGRKIRILLRFHEDRLKVELDTSPKNKGEVFENNAPMKPSSRNDIELIQKQTGLLFHYLVRHKVFLDKNKAFHSECWGKMTGWKPYQINKFHSFDYVIGEQGVKADDFSRVIGLLEELKVQMENDRDNVFPLKLK